MGWPRLTQCSKEKLLASVCGVIFLFVVLVNVNVIDQPKRIIKGLSNSSLESLLSSIPSRLGLGFSSEIPDATSQLYERSERLSKECRKLSQNNPRFLNHEMNMASVYRTLYQNSDYKLIYCQIQKVGSSFWKRVFKVLDSSNKNDRHLFDIPSMNAHTGIPASMRLSHNNTDKILQSYTKFMFTRDPFSRLFSGYVDKLMIPNNMVEEMIKRIRSWMGQKVTDDCDYYVEFPHFCAYIANIILSKKELDPHFAPIYTHCEPCLLNFTLIGKMETFMDDTRGILEVAGVELSRVTGDVEDVDATNEVGLIKDMIARTYSHMSKRYTTTERFVGCATRLEMLQRLWRVFQIRGFVSKDNNFPERFKKSKQAEIDKYDFEEAAIYAYEHSSERSIRLLQREESLMEAYGTVPPDILKKLGLAFATDCALFDYSCDVTKRFLKNYQKSNFSYFEL